MDAWCRSLPRTLSRGNAERNARETMRSDANKSKQIRGKDRCPSRPISNRPANPVKRRMMAAN